ncbi:hypothetical protein VIGAN_02141000, partial [Vigna angularis var. angularis]
FLPCLATLSIPTPKSNHLFPELKLPRPSRLQELRFYRLIFRFLQPVILTFWECKQVVYGSYLSLVVYTRVGDDVPLEQALEVEEDPTPST